MISRESFIKTMECISEHHKHEDALASALAPFGFGYGSSDISDSIESRLVYIVEEALGDANGWTSYFLYERYGRLDSECVFEKDGTPVDTSDWGKVYDLIVSQDSPVDAKDDYS